MQLFSNISTWKNCTIQTSIQWCPYTRTNPKPSCNS